MLQHHGKLTGALKLNGEASISNKPQPAESDAALVVTPDREGELPLYLKQDHAFGMVNEGVSSLFGSTSDRRLASVPLRRFDDLAREADLRRLDFLKVDVEGAEWMVLRGAEQSLRAFRPVIVAESSARNFEKAEQSLRAFRPVIVAESSAQNFEKAGYAPKDLYAYLESLDYEIRALEDGSIHLPSECDVLCIPRSPKPARSPSYVTLD